MADVQLAKIVLKDNWPGAVTPKKSIPTDGFDSTTENDVTIAAHPIGTKIEKYTDLSGVQGMSRFIYLRYYCLSSGEAVEDVSDGWAIFQQFCNSTCVSADGTANALTCTNKTPVDTGYKCGTSGGVVAVACSSRSVHDVTTDGNNGGGYGWFWCGGVCPIDITTLDCDVTTGGGVAAGGQIYIQDDASNIQFDGADLSVNGCGWSLETDA